MKCPRTYFLALAAIGCCSLSEPAEAQLLYAGGAIVPAPVYRLLFDCHSIQVDGNPAGPTWPNGNFVAAYPISPSCPNSAGDNSGLFMQILYAPVGPLTGVRALINHDGSSNSTGLGPGFADTVPIVSSLERTYDYPSLQFIGNDYPWTAQNAADYVTSGDALNYGSIIQMPALVVAVVVVFNRNDGNGRQLNIANSVPAGAQADKATFGYPDNYSGVNLTRKALCGIFTGHITAWNDPELTASNRGIALGAGPISVIHPQFSDGTNFVFTSALYRQCQGITGPLNTADALSGSPQTRSWEFRFSERTNAACPDALYRAGIFTNWPDNGTDICTPAAPLNNNPGGGQFIGLVPGGGQYTIFQRIASTPGAIGFASVNNAPPFFQTGNDVLVANIQSQYDLDNNTGAFQWPSPTRISNAMAGLKPIFPDAQARANPLNWSSQSQVPNPITPNSYPIVGFTWFNFYQCYDDTRSGGGTFANLLNYLTFHYYDSSAAAIINSKGFATIPDAWRDEIIPLLTDGPSQMGKGGDPAVGCGSKRGA